MYEDTINWRKWSQLDPIKKRNFSLEKDKYNGIQDPNQIGKKQTAQSVIPPKIRKSLGISII